MNSFSFLSALTSASARVQASQISCDGRCITIMSTGSPTLVVPVIGRATLTSGGSLVEGGTGCFFMVHEAVQVSMKVCPQGMQPYRALRIPFPWRTIELARQIFATPVVPHCSRLSTGNLITLATTLKEWANDDGDPSTMEYRLVGILLALRKAGHDAFLAAKAPGLAIRIRSLVGTYPDRNWPSSYFESEFHMSGATLRRRLCKEGTTLRQVIREARLHAALGMLQTSHQPVKTVAAAVGYRTVESFRQQFLNLFGVEPSVIAKSGVDAVVTDRLGI